MTSDQLDVPETQSANIKTTTADEKDANGSPCGRRIGAVVRRAELPGDLDGVRHQQVVVGVEDLGLVTAVLSNQQRIDVVLVDVLESVQSSVVVMTFISNSATQSLLGFLCVSVHGFGLQKVSAIPFLTLELPLLSIGFLLGFVQFISYLSRTLKVPMRPMVSSMPAMA